MDKLEAAIGGFSRPSKMPWLGWGIPAKDCKAGSKLAQIVSTICSICYANRNYYNLPHVQDALRKRLTLYETYGPTRWAAKVSAALNQEKYMVMPSEMRYFRWFDSGDLQSADMCCAIMEVATHTAHIKHWLPTREAAFVGKALRTWGKRPYPKNLVIRFSQTYIDEELPKHRLYHTSGVTTFNAICPAHTQGNQCRECRKCWDDRVMHVTYKRH